MMRSADIALFEITFDELCDILDDYGIDFSWGEKDRQAAFTAWNRYCELSEREQSEIGDRIIENISIPLKDLITSVLDDSLPREIKKVKVHVTTNLGETKIYTFESVEQAISFLEDIDSEELLSTADSPMLFDNVDPDEA